MRICFVGNSHIGTAKFGWDAVAPEYPEVEASFFGAISNIFVNTAIEGGRLVGKSEEARQSFMRTSGGRDAVVFEEYDLIVLLGPQFGLWLLLDLYDKYRWGGQHNTEGNYEPVSTGYLREIAKARLARSILIRYRDKIKGGGNLSSPKVWIYPEPMPSQLVLTSSATQRAGFSASQLSALRQAAKWQDEASLSNAFSDACVGFSSSEDVVFEQPPHTLDRDIFTRQEYSKRSVIPGSQAVRKVDFVHTNAKFGELMVRQILDRANVKSASA
jgi:hypothetical protein